MLCKMNSQKSMTVHTSNKHSTFPTQYPRFKIWITLIDENNKSIVLLSNKKIQNGFKTLHGKIRYQEDLKTAVFRVTNWLIGSEVAKMIYREFDGHIEKFGEPIKFSFHNSENKFIQASCQHYKIELSCSVKEFMDIVSKYKRNYIKILSPGDILRIREYNGRTPSSEELILFWEDVRFVKKIFEV